MPYRTGVSSHAEARMPDALLDLKRRYNVLDRKAIVSGLTPVEWVEQENLGRLIVIAEAGYRPVAVAA